MRRFSPPRTLVCLFAFVYASAAAALDFKYPPYTGQSIPFDQYLIYYGDFDRDFSEDIYFHGFAPAGLHPATAESLPGFAYFGRQEGGYQTASPWDMTGDALRFCGTCTRAQENTDFALGDMNGDGIRDLLIKGRDANQSSLLISGLDEAGLPRVLLEILPTGHVRVPGQEASREPYFRNNLRDADVRIIGGKLWVDGTSHSLSQMRVAASRNQASTTKTLSSQTLSSLSSTTSSTVSAFNIPAPPTPVLPTHTLTAAQIADIDALATFGGEFRINEMGAATYTVPIELPIGTAGVTPELALAYSSQAGVSNMGLGWSLQAGGVISRCRQTLQQDGAALAIQFNEQDPFCLDGQRLLLVSGTYGANGATYKTEIDGGLIVTSFGTVTGHPDYFEVTAKDGSTSIYGGTDNHNSEQRGRNSAGSLLTNRTLNWGLAEFRDSVGNKIVYTYESTAQYFRLASITYGYGSGTVADVQVSFQYATRKKSDIGWVKDSRFEDNSLLTSIQVLDKTLLVKEYRITYNEVAANALGDLMDRATRIDSCVGSVCAQPIKLLWGFASPGAASKGNGRVTTYSNNLFSFESTGFAKSGFPTDFIREGDRTIPAWAVNNLSLVNLAPGQFIHSYQEIDINGDGRSDLVIVTANTVSPKGFGLFTLRQSDQGFAGLNSVEVLPGDPTISGGAQEPQLHVVDFNQDGRHDLAVYLPASGTWRTYFSQPQTDGTWSLVKVNNFLFTGLPETVTFVDANSDSMPDLLYIRDNKIYTHHLRRTGTDQSERAYSYVAAHDYVFDLPRFDTYLRWGFAIRSVGDSNGDGRMDYLVSALKTRIVGQDEHFRSLICEASEGFIRFSSDEQGGYSQTALPISEQETFLVPHASVCANVATDSNASKRIVGPTNSDIDGDGLSDLLWLIKSSQGARAISFRRGLPNNQFGASQSLSFGIDAFGFDLLDTDSDGDQDLLIFGKDDAQWIARWNGTGFDAPVVHMSSLANRQTRYTDIDSDGNIDRMTLQDGKLTVARGRPRHNNLVVRFVSGLDNFTAVFYEPLRDSARYQKMEGIKTVQTGTTPGGSICPPVADMPCTTYSPQPVYAVDSSSFYSQINNPFAGLDPETDLQLYKGVPAQELIPTAPVVTRVVSSAPTTISSRQRVGVDYRYEGLKIQAGGRGMLGFKKLTTTDMQTGVTATTEYRQDWPFAGTPIRTVTTTRHGQLMSESTSRMRIHGITSANIADKRLLAKSGTARLGPLVLYTQETRDIAYDVPQGLLAMPDGTQTSPTLTQNKLKEIVTTTQVDANNNVIQLDISTLTGTGSVAELKSTVNTYYSGSGERYGRLLRSVVTVSRLGEETKSRTAEFSYNGYSPGYTGAPTDCPAGALTGLLCSEKVSTADLRNSEAPLFTQHFYDSRGNKTHTRTGTRLSPFVQYDAKGRYVQSTYDIFASDTFTADTAPSGYTAPAGAVVLKTGEIVERDKFGSPLRSRARVGQNTWVDQVQAATPFGTVFFQGDATGVFEQTYMRRSTSDTNCPGMTAFTKTVARAGGATATECYDTAGKVIGGYRTSLQGTVIRHRQDHDLLGRVVRTFEPALGAAPSLSTDTVYDVLGRPVLVTHPFFVTDAAGTKSTTRASTRYAYIGSTREITHSGHSGDVDRIRSEIPRITGELRFVLEMGQRGIRHEYDSQGNLRLTRDHGGNDTVIFYNGLGQKIEMQDHNKGTWTYRYNSYGDLYQQTDAKGTVTTFVYDFKGRKIREEVRPATGSGMTAFDLRWEFDRAANGLGQINRESKTNTSGTAEFVRQTTFDSLGRGAEISTQFAGAGSQMETHYQKVTFDEFGRIFQTFDAARVGADFNGNATQNSYNARGYLIAVRDAATSSSFYEISATDARGNATQVLMGSGESETYGFDPRTGFLETISRTGVLGATQNYTAVWDHLGNLVSRSDSLLGGTPETFRYDQFNRLTRNTLAGSSATVDYDTADNITSKSDFEGGLTYQYHATKKHAVWRVGNREFDYDANGNVTQERRNGTVAKNLSYTGNDLVQRVTHNGHTSEFFYGPDNQRYKRIDTDSSNRRTVTLYIGNVEKIHYHDGAVEWKRQIGGIAQVTHALTSGTPDAGTKHYFHKDHLGSITAITDGNGSVLTRMAFNPWGARRTIINNVWLGANMRDSSILSSYAKSAKPRTSRGYTGHEMLDEVGIIHMNGRIYDAYLARFLQADPFVQSPTSPASLNRFSYVMNNPMNAVDPSGYFSLRSLNPLRVTKKILDEMSIVGSDLFKETFRSTARALGYETSMFLVSIGSFFCGPAAAACAAVGTYNVARAFGATSSEAFRAGAIAGATTYAFQWVGQTFTGAEGTALARNGPLHILSHATVGGVSSVLQGGKFGHGFFSAGFTKWATPYIAGIDSFMVGDISVTQAAIAGLIGGTVSDLTGGKFANGFTTATFGNIFNQQASAAQQRRWQPRAGVSPEHEKQIRLLESLATEAAAEVDATCGLTCKLLPFERGARIHAAFAHKVWLTGGYYDAEVSYLDGNQVSYGTVGSSRADAIYGLPAAPEFAVELKTGWFPFISDDQINNYMKNLPQQTT